MSRFPETAVATLVLLIGAQVVAAERSEIGRPASAAEIAIWDIDVRPDGQGLPTGRGSAADGEAIYAERCAQCHGDFGEGIGRYPALIGGGDSLATENPVRTVGSYWPYATTLWDYIRRTMPFGDAQSLGIDETYAVTAYVLYLSDLVTEDRSLDATSLPPIEMPNRGGFTDAPAPDSPSEIHEPCMAACKGRVEVTGVAPPLADALGQ